jgi:hypothetical protein
MHSTNDLNDGYVGSGKILRYSIRKYGLENHRFEILEHLSDRKSLFLRESEMVNQDLLSDPLCMNLRYGGDGGWEHINTNTSLRIEKNKKAREITAKKLEKTYGSEYQSILGKKGGKIRVTLHPNLSSEIAKRGHLEGWLSFKGKKHTEESKEKMRKSKNVGMDNSQYGSMWITNGTDNKKIKKNDLIPTGWFNGRKMNHI